MRDVRRTASSTCAWLNRGFDALVRPRLRCFGHAVEAFRWFGYLGFACALVLAASLAVARGLSLRVFAASVVMALACFFITAIATKLIAGEEQLVYYHHEYAVLAGVGWLLRTLGVPVLPYLDIIVVGIGTFLVFGRGGCLMVGCCHGRPAELGVRYGAAHVDDGFTWYYEDVRLLPVQLFEALGVLAIVALGTIAALRDVPSGVVLAGYVTGYGSLRFYLEFLRGDPERPYWWGFSEAQWFSVSSALGVAMLGWLGALPMRAWHLWALVALAASMAWVAIARAAGNDRRRRFVEPRHVCELAELLESLAQTPERPGGSSANAVLLRCGSTSKGLVVARGRVTDSNGEHHHYSLSCNLDTLRDAEAAAVARVIYELRHRHGDKQLIRPNLGVYHFMVRVQ